MCMLHPGLGYTSPHLPPARSSHSATRRARHSCRGAMQRRRSDHVDLCPWPRAALLPVRVHHWRPLASTSCAHCPLTPMPCSPSCHVGFDCCVPRSPSHGRCADAIDRINASLATNGKEHFATEEAWLPTMLSALRPCQASASTPSTPSRRNASRSISKAEVGNSKSKALSTSGCTVPKWPTALLALVR